MVTQHVDHRYGRHFRHAHNDVVPKDAGGKDAVVARHHGGDVLGGFTYVDADLFAARVDGVSTQLHDGDLHRVPRTVRRLFEDQRGTEAVEGAAERSDRPLREVENETDVVGGQLGDVEKMAGPHCADSFCTRAKAPAKIATASSTCARDTLSGGAIRIVVALTALTTRPSARHAL